MKEYSRHDIEMLLENVNVHVSETEEIDIYIDIHPHMDGYNIVAIKGRKKIDLINNIPNLEGLGLCLEGMNIMISLEHLL